ncbi:MAG: hypothetical protein QXI18_02915 [Nitrososphaerota archaeon]
MSSTGKIALIMLGLLTLILLINLIIPTQAQEGPTLTVKVSTMDKKPLAGAYVELRYEDETKIDVKKTGSDGRVTFDNVAGDKLYRIYVYYPAGHRVGYEHSIDITKTPSVDIEVNVVSKWTIYVYDGKERDSVPGAKVFLTHRRNNTITYLGSTDSSGKVEFGPIPSDAYYGIIVEFRGKNYSLEDKNPSDGITRLTLPLYRVVLTIIDRKNSPVKGVVVELREELDREPVGTAVSELDGKAVIKLIPTNTRWYVMARLKGIIVYQSDGKEVEVLNDDFSKKIAVDAVRLNITVMDYDGEDILRNYTLIGKLIKDGGEVGSAESNNGVLYFGHTPFENYTLRIMLGDLIVYSGAYEVKIESAEGAVKAWFYDIKIRVNASALVNASLTKSLLGELRTSGLRFEFQAADWEASIRNVPKSDNYEAILFYSGREIFRAGRLKIIGENQVLWLNLTGCRLNITAINLDEKPVSANIVVLLEGVGAITSFKTDEAGRGSPGRLLPLTYKLEAYVDGIPVGWESVDLTSDMSVRMKLSLKNVYFRILDRDGEEALENTALTLTRGKFSRSGKYIGNGTLLVENLPIAEYKLIVTYYGFKVLEDFIEISPEDKLLELKAPGVLDLELIFLDSDKNPLDQGRAIISFGEHEFEEKIGEDGRAIFRDLPNITLSIAVFYKGVKIKTEPSEIDLIRDDMKAMIACSVYSFGAEILRGDGRPLNDGMAVLYINNMRLKAYNLAEGNRIFERLPEGDLRIEIKYRGRSAGNFSTYLEKIITGLAIYSTVFPVEIFVRNPDGSAVAGARLIIEDELGVVAEAVSGDDGALRLLLPAAKSYNVTMRVGNETHSFKLSVEKSKSLSFLRPTLITMGFELAIAASAIDLAISGYAISRLPHRRQQPRRETRRARSFPRI